MISNTYPHNRLQKRLLSRGIRAYLFILGVGVLVGLTVVFGKPNNAYAADSLHINDGRAVYAQDDLDIVAAGFQITIEGWAKLDTIYSGRAPAFFNFHHNDTSPYLSGIIGAWYDPSLAHPSGDNVPTANNGYPKSLYAFIHRCGQSDPNMTVSLGSGTDLTQWHHYALTYTRGDRTARLYFDGTLKTSVVLAGEIGSGDCGHDQVTMGARPQNDSTAVSPTFSIEPANSMEGNLSNWRVWNTAKTGAQINGNKCVVYGSAGGLLSNWILDGDANDSINFTPVDLSYTEAPPTVSVRYENDIPSCLGQSGAGQYALYPTSTAPYITGNQINFQLTWNNADFNVFREHVYRNSATPSDNYILGQNNNLGSTNSLSMNITYTGSGYKFPVVVLGDANCTGASSTGTFLTGGGCQQQVVSASALYVYGIQEYLATSSGSALFQWIGGNNPNLYGSGSVLDPTDTGSGGTAAFEWITGTGSIYYDQNVTATGALGMGALGANGIFSTGILNFTGFGNSGNVFLDAAQLLLLIVLYAALWVAQFLFHLLQLTAFFSWFYGIFHPVAGSTHMLPEFIMGFPNPIYTGESYVVQYAPNTGNYQNVTKAIQISVVISMLYWVADHFLIHNKKKQ